MNQKKSIIMIAALAVLLLIGAYVLYQQLGDRVGTSQLATLPQQTETVGVSGDATDTAESNLAPDFQVYNWNENPIKLSDLRGKPVILNFWASWCDPCKLEMPDFDAAYKEYGEQIHFVMVNMTDGSRESVGTASKFILDEGYTFPVYFDSDGEAAAAYDVLSIPTTYFIDAEGYGVAWAKGTMTAEMINKGIGMLIAP